MRGGGGEGDGEGGGGGGGGGGGDIPMFSTQLAASYYLVKSVH